MPLDGAWYVRPNRPRALVGLRVAVERIAGFVATDEITRPAASQAPATSGRVRVFRSKPRQEAAIS